MLGEEYVYVEIIIDRLLQGANGNLREMASKNVLFIATTCKQATAPPIPSLARKSTH